MKHHSALLTLFLSTFFYANVHAQNAVKDRIVGCWKLDKIVFTDPADGEGMPEEILNSVACLQKGGKFVTTTNGTTVNGIYMISEDGKTITQRMTGGEDDVAEITLLTDTNLEFNVGGAVLKMIRVKE